MWRAVACVCVLVVGGVAAAAPAATDPALEQRFRADLAAVSADAAAAWDEGNAARDGMRAGDAEAAYRRVIALAPRIDHPHRRLCGVLGHVGRLDEAVRECELALSLAPASAYDKSSLAAVLAVRGDQRDRPRATTLAREAAEALPGDASTVELDCSMRALGRDLDATSACVDHLLALAPNDLTGNQIAAGIAVVRGDYTHASIYLERAKDAGLAPSVYADLRGRLDKLRHRDDPSFSLSTDEALAYGVPIVGGWILLWILLLVIGNRLSDATMRSIEHGAVEDSATTSRLRRIYRVVLVLCGLLFYASLPLMIAVVVFAALAVLAMFDAMGATPVIVLWVVGALVISTILAVVRSLFVTNPLKIEGKPIELARYPKLASLLREVAEAIGTRPIDVVYLTPGTDAGVLEQRSIWRSLRGKPSERILLLGVGLFDGMKQLELRAILAHEHGHFRNDDAGGAVALAVQRSLLGLVTKMAASRAATIFNPAWWFVRAFANLFAVVSRGASRLQETLADRWAIRACGSAAFIAGYRHKVARDVELAHDLAQTIKDVIENRWSLPNLYAYAPERPARSALDAAIARRMDREPQRFDSHPPPRQRIAAAEILAVPAPHTRPEDGEPVWSLFDDPEQIEREMTAIIRDRIRLRHGVTVTDEEWDDDHVDGAEVPGEPS